VHREGIRSVSAADIAAAKGLGRTVKLLAICERVVNSGQESVAVRVHPAMIPRTHPLASVHGAFNAVFVETESAGELMFYGRGAGGAPTASAVLGDVVSAARNRVLGGRGPVESSYADLPVLPASAAVTRHCVRLHVVDRPGVLAQVAFAMADHGVSIEAVRQSPAPHADAAPGEEVAHLMITTHASTHAALTATTDAVAALDAVLSVRSVLRVEGS
jgi:homoserine dehydrogenase